MCRKCLFYCSTIFYIYTDIDQVWIHSSWLYLVPSLRPGVEYIYFRLGTSSARYVDILQLLTQLVP